MDIYLVDHDNNMYGIFMKFMTPFYIISYMYSNTQVPYIHTYLPTLLCGEIKTHIEYETTRYVRCALTVPFLVLVKSIGGGFRALSRSPHCTDSYWKYLHVHNICRANLSPHPSNIRISRRIFHLPSSISSILGAHAEVMFMSMFRRDQCSSSCLITKFRPMPHFPSLLSLYKQLASSP